MAGDSEWPLGAEGLSPTAARNLIQSTTSVLGEGLQASGHTVLPADPWIVGGATQSRGGRWGGGSERLVEGH